MAEPKRATATGDGGATAVRRIRRIHRVSVAAAVIVLVLTLVSIIARPTACGDLPSSYSPIIAFELARSAGDLQSIFGPVAEPCQRTLIAALDRINLIDLALFIPAYGLFLITAFLGLGWRGRPLARAGVVLAAIAVVADVAENVCLLGLTPLLDHASGWMAALPWVTGVKWLALGAVGAAAGVALWPGERRHHQVSAALCMLTPLSAIAAIADPHRFGPLVGTGVAVSWLMLLTDGVAQARARG